MCARPCVKRGLRSRDRTRAAPCRATRARAAPRVSPGGATTLAATPIARATGRGKLVQRIRLVGADVEDLVPAFGTSIASAISGATVVDVAEGSRLRAVAEDGHRLALQDLVHEDADDVAVAIGDVLMRAVDVVRAKDDVVQARRGLGTRRSSSSTACLAMPYESSGCARRLLGHRQLRTRAVDGDRRGEDEGLHAGVHRRVEQVDAADHVVRVVEPLDEVAQPFGRVGGQVIDRGEALFVRRAGRPAERRRCCRGQRLRPAGRCRDSRRSGRRGRSPRARGGSGRPPRGSR